ncbi:hypothetical protein F1C10_01910 [Sphingomonas sp. NBWT7]|uniref:type I-E CRISPR-associated protein Cas5/CasD n=1 Tax=Sphingomonas sp. NBWT7 TaxID=2596913 RepID=UPI0016246979|nr:type I-E CRISPR-associated protein Cas5/CasD [Sphingomonas sp. NBWT7]QNE30845.1 hypothetical protein F1C10_01910 [Sphingomonas sp. NBWT7]
MNKTRATSVRIELRGMHACFRRPEFVDDLISYDVISPLAATRLLSAISTRPDTQWIVRRLWVQRPIAFEWLTMQTARGQKRALVLRDVAYTLDAELDSAVGEDVIATRSDGRAHLGLTDFKADVSMVDSSVPPRTAYGGTGKIDLGWMIHDLDGRGRSRARYFRAEMIDGLIDLDQSQPLELVS